MKLQTERSSYRSQIETETQQVIGEKETLLNTAETNLARIRSYRDELLADQAVRKAAQEQERTSLKHITDLAAAREERIKAQEAEMERLRTETGDSVSPSPAVEQMDPDELRSKYQTLDRQYNLLRNELESMQAAYQKAMKAGSLKVSDFSALEEKVMRLSAEKAKADQKFFGAMKSKETRELEVRTLRMQNVKSSDVVSQLKESEATSRALLANLEKQLAELRDALTTTTSNYRASQQSEAESKIVVEGLRGQIEELKKLLVQKDFTIAATGSSFRQKEQELEDLQATLADTKKSLESWKARGLGNQTDEYEALRVSSAFDCKKETRLIRALVNRSLPSLPKKLQEYRHQDVRPRLLQGMCRGAPIFSFSQVPSLQQVVRIERLYEDHSLVDSFGDSDTPVYNDIYVFLWRSSMA